MSMTEEAGAGKPARRDLCRRRRVTGGPTATPVVAANLTSHILNIVDAKADQAAVRFLRRGEIEERAVSYAELDTRARCIAARLVDEGLAGTQALLIFPAAPPLY